MRRFLDRMPDKKDGVWAGQKYLSHKTVDLIEDHDYLRTPLRLFGANASQFEALIQVVQGTARFRNMKLHVRIHPDGHEITIYCVGRLV